MIDDTAYCKRTATLVGELELTRLARLKQVRQQVVTLLVNFIEALILIVRYVHPEAVPLLSRLQTL